MIRALHVAEKPSVAKKVAEHLGSLGERPGHCRQGPSVYNRLFEFETPGTSQTGHRRVKHTVTSVTGHLMASEFAEPHNKWHACAPRDLLREDVSSVEFRVADDKLPLKKQLEEEAVKHDWLVLWLDCDREGEAIAYEVVDVCRAKKASLDLYRAVFSSVDKQSICTAWRSLKRPDKRKADAVAARSELDLRAGAAFTRFQTFRIDGRYEDVTTKVVSYGPCQFPTLGFIVQRQQEIEKHDQQRFWKIELATTIDSKRVSWMWRRKRVYDEQVASLLFARVKASQGVVEKIEAKIATQQRPVPLCTLELQKRASRWLRLAPDATMEVADKLYQNALISYPRTETEIFKPGLDLKDLIDRQRRDPRFASFAGDLLDQPSQDPRAFCSPRAGRRDDEAHPPIHPMGDGSTLSDPRQKAVFELVTRHFLACCAKDGVGRQTLVDADVGGEKFEARGLIIDQRGWLDIYRWERWSGTQLPLLVEGQSLDIAKAKLELVAGRTQPPSLLTETDLLSKMDKHGIGTDATMADHIKTVLTREYATRANDPPHVLKPTPLGRALVDAYDAMGERLNRPELRAAAEADFTSIANGKKSKDVVIAETLKTMRRCFDVVQRDVKKLDDAMRRRFGGMQQDGPAPIAIAGFAGCTCGDCGCDMQLFTRNDRPSLRCEMCETWWPLPDRQGVRIAPRAGTCPLCQFQLVDVQFEGSDRKHPHCPHCYTAPPPGAHAGASGGKMGCRDCAAAGCALATGVRGGSLAVAACACGGELRLRRTPTAKFVLGCTDSKCRSVAWFPSAVAAARVLEDSDCPKCSAPGAPVRRLKLKLPSAKVPPGTELEPTLCALCCRGEILNLGFDRRKLKVGGRGRGGGRATGGRGRGGRTRGPPAPAGVDQNKRPKVAPAAPPRPRGGAPQPLQTRGPPQPRRELL